MVRRRSASLLVAFACAMAGFFTARCERGTPVSFAPPFDLCCWCLATHSTPRGARCSRGSIADCISDLERLDILGSETNARCIRSVCGAQCAPIAALLPSEESIASCCECLATQEQDGTDCYSGTADECATEIDEGETNKLLQGGAICMDGVCAQDCAELFGGAVTDAGQEDAGGEPGEDAGPEDAGNVVVRDSGPGPTLPWDGGCPLNFPCF